MTRFTLEAVIPGGVRPTDHVHHVTNDDTCSRCRKPCGDEVPLVLFFHDGNDALIYCEACTGDEAWAAMAPVVPT